MHSPLTRLVASRMAEMGATLEDRTRPVLKDGPPRSTLNRYMQPGVWLSDSLKVPTIKRLAVALDVDVAVIRRAAYDSIDPDKAAAAAGSGVPPSMEGDDEELAEILARVRRLDRQGLARLRTAFPLIESS